MSTPANNGPKSAFNTFNLVTGAILVVGLILTVLRFTQGIGPVTNLDDNNPWGIWIGFDLLCGVALAAGGYTTSAACYVFGLKRFHSAVRPAILTAFLGYALVVFALQYDLGRPWRLPYPHLRFPGYHLPAFRSRSVRYALPDCALYRVHSGHVRMAGLEENQKSGC